jgi:hypothetical protein
MKKGEMSGGIHQKSVGGEIFTKFLVRKPEKKRPLERPGHRQKNAVS